MLPTLHYCCTVQAQLLMRTSAKVVILFSMMGPLWSSISKGTPSAVRGVRMSLHRDKLALDCLRLPLVMSIHSIGLSCILGLLMPLSNFTHLTATPCLLTWMRQEVWLTLAERLPYLNKITPSGWKECQGCKLISTIRSVFSDLHSSLKVCHAHSMLRWFLRCVPCDLQLKVIVRLSALFPLLYQPAAYFRKGKHSMQKLCQGTAFAMMLHAAMKSAGCASSPFSEVRMLLR